MPNTNAPQTETHPSTAQQSSSLQKRWAWAYRKIRSLDCGMPTAAWHAARFALFGKSGRFMSSRGWTKLKASSD